MCGGDPWISVNPPVTARVSKYAASTLSANNRVAQVNPNDFDSGELGLEVLDQHTAVVEPELPGLEHVPVDRRRVIVLHDELDHRVAEVAERV